MERVKRYADLRERAVEFIAKTAADGPVLVLAPARGAADEIARAACGRALVGVHRLGFRELAAQLAEEEMNRRGLVPVGRFVREALAARVTAGARLKYLAPVASFPGFPRALTETFEELRLNGVEPARLAECGESGHDLAVLLQAYNRELERRGFADYAMRVSLARGDVAGMAVVAVDLAPRTRLERELLEKVMGSARERVEMSLQWGAGFSPPEFAQTPSGAEAPRGLKPAPQRHTSLDSLQRYLFSAEPVPRCDEDGTVEIFSTSGEALECVEIARRIHASVAEGVSFDEIAILLRSPERHQPLVLEALRRAGVPAVCSMGTVRPDVAGRSFLALLACAEERLSASRFAEYLSLGQMKKDEETHTPAMWERALVDAAVIGGPERWKTRLAGWREELHRRYREERDEAIERKIAAVENLERVALPVIAKLAELPRRALWGEWIAALIGLAEFTLREPERVIELIEELEPMSDIGPVALGEVMLVLGPRLHSLRAEPKGARYGKVWIGAIEEARGMSFRRVFVPGVNEGLFPRPPAEDPLLLKAQREALGIELRAEDTELLHIAAGCASERLTLSYSRLDLLTGRERVPSYYTFEAHRAAGGREMEIREFEERARSKTPTRIGWPAPENPADAIDDAEFDLAMLAPREKGSGQYLKGLGRSVESLRARWVRWHKPWKAADGLVVDEIGNEDTAAYRLAARAWSPTLLQQYARCPYRFALRGIFGLRPREQPGAIQRLDAATRGQIFHEVQFELMRDLPPDLGEALARLDGILRRVAAKHEAELAPAIPMIWHAEVQVIRADLRGWLQQRAADWKPEYAELSFGLKDPAGRDPRSRVEPVELHNGFRLQGSIDLVERRSDGVLRVVDHKTGKIPDPKPEMMGGGELLQPALYALAAEKILDEEVACGRLYYATIAQNYTAIDVPLNSFTRARTEQVLRVIDDAVRDGFLPAAPRKDGCKQCEYLPVCGPYEEERVREHKSQPELKALKDLRGMR